MPRVGDQGDGVQKESRAELDGYENQIQQNAQYESPVQVIDRMIVRVCHDVLFYKQGSRLFGRRAGCLYV